MKNLLRPDQHAPALPRDLIGGAAQIAAAALKRALDLKSDERATLKLCFFGPPGTGKTTIANMVAAALAANKFEIETVNGRDLTIDKVREWMRAAAYPSLWNGWTVKVVNEMDLVPLAAQDLLLSHLDELPAHHAIIGTSNESRDTLSARFCSRFAQIKVTPPTSEELAAWLVSEWRVPKKIAPMLALAACGNVREALLQAAGWLDFGVLPEKPAPAVAAPVKCAARSDAARRAWDTMRARKEAFA